MNVEQLVNMHADCTAADYEAAKPFPHVVIDDFLPAEIAWRAEQGFPPLSSTWQHFCNGREVKFAQNDVREMPSYIAEILLDLNSGHFLRWLEWVTGIHDLLPDPHFMGGGMHQIPTGGKLGVHVDFNRHPNFDLDRRLNLLLYLNSGWQMEWGGHLELWNERHVVERIVPIFNRCVIFSTTERSWHGHPMPLSCPPDRTRKSLALYYYTNGRPERERAANHSTVFLERT